jgi:hypothetical protein
MKNSKLKISQLENPIVRKPIVGKCEMVKGEDH